MKICKSCGYENHDVAKVCNKCSKRLDEEIETSGQDPVMKHNVVVSLLEGAGALALIVLGIAGLVMFFNVFEYSPVTGFTLLLGYGLSGFIVFALLKGIAEIIKILQEIKGHISTKMDEH